MMGLSEIDKNRIAEIWKRYLDPPSSIRKWLEEHDKKVQCVFSYTFEKVFRYSELFRSSEFNS
jgi:hypothetical protein